MKRIVLGIVACLCLGSPALSAEADFVFLFDASAGMSDDIATMRSGLSTFSTSLAGAGIDSRFAVVLFGDTPELVLDFTSNITAVDSAFGQVGTAGAVAGFQRDHSVDPEAGLEAARIVVGAAVNGGDAVYRTNVGGTGDLVFRPTARRNLILLTDEDSDAPSHAANRLAGQLTVEPPAPITGTDWQVAVGNTAQALIAGTTHVDLWVNPLDVPTTAQYGDPAQNVYGVDYTNWNASQTLANLVAQGLGNCLQAQLLQNGVTAKAYDVNDIGQMGIADNYFAVKVAENVPEPATLALVALGGLGTALRRRRQDRSRASRTTR